MPIQEHESEQVVVGGAAVAEGVAAGRVLIAPWGRVNSSNGDFVVDEEAGRLVTEAFAAHGTDVPIDYEHQSLGGKYSSPSGQAPAAGWIKALRMVGPNDRLEAGPTRKAESGEEPGLYAEVEWTTAAREKLAAREYRYLSPVVIVRKRDRRVVALHSAALTNKPAIVGMRPIVNKAGRNEGMNEGMKEETGSGLEAVGGQREANPENAFEVLRLRLGLDEQADAGAVIVAAERRLVELEGAVRQREAEERVQLATRAGKLVPAQRDWAMGLALRDPAGFDEWAATAPAVVMLGRTDPPEASGGPRNRSVVIASARAAFRAEPQLTMLTSESAWVEQTLREAGLEEREAGGGKS